MRLLASKAAWPDVPIAFAPEPDSGISIETLPSSFRGILAWFGIPESHIVLLQQPVLATELRVQPQAEQLADWRDAFGVGPEPAYLDLLDALGEVRLGRLTRQGFVYVSRSAREGRFAGERYLEEVLRELGATVIRPEGMAIADQLRTYAGADVLLFAEGSALHGCQLLGRALGQVAVLVRRPGLRLAEASMAPRARTLSYLDTLTGLVTGADFTGRPAPYWGLSIVNEDLLVTSLNDLGLTVEAGWQPSTYRAARDADVLDWLQYQAARSRFDHPANRPLVHQTLEDAGLGHLRKAADAIFDALPPRRSPGVSR